MEESCSHPFFRQRNAMPPKLALAIAIVSAALGAICGAPLVTDHETVLRVIAVGVLAWNSGQWFADWQWMRI